MRLCEWLQDDFEFRCARFRRVRESIDAGAEALQFRAHGKLFDARM